MEVRELIIEDITSLLVKIDKFLDKDDPEVLMASGLIATAQHLLDISGGDDESAGYEESAGYAGSDDGSGLFEQNGQSEQDESYPDDVIAVETTYSPAATRSLADDMGIGFEEGATKLRATKPRRPAQPQATQADPAPRRAPPQPRPRPGSRRAASSSNGEATAPSRPRRNLADEWAGPLPKRRPPQVAPQPSSQPAAPPAAPSRRKVPPTVPASGICVNCNGYYGGEFHPVNRNYPLLNGQIAAVTLCDGRAVYPVGGVPSKSPGE